MSQTAISNEKSLAARDHKTPKNSNTEQNYRLCEANNQPQYGSIPVSKSIAFSAHIKGALTGFLAAGAEVIDLLEMSLRKGMQ